MRNVGATMRAPFGYEYWYLGHGYEAWVREKAIVLIGKGGLDELILVRFISHNNLFVSMSVVIICRKGVRA